MPSTNSGPAQTLTPNIVAPQVAAGSTSVAYDPSNVAIGGGSASNIRLGAGIVSAAYSHPTLYPSAAAVTPTFATTGPGGVSAISPKSTLAYNSASVNLVGCVPFYANLLGTDYFQNNAAAVQGSGTTPCAVEFGFYGADFDIIFRNGIGGASFFWVWATDPDTGIMRPQTGAPVASTANSANSQFYYRVTFSSTAERVVRVYYCGADFGGIDYAATATVFAVPKPARSLCIVSDSYGSGTGATTAMQSWAVTLGRLLGTETFVNAVGGTGYVQGSTTNSYLAPTRVAAAIASGATDFLLAGSINDSTFTPAQVMAAAASLVSQIQTSLPKARFWFSGVQMLPVGYNTGNNVANNSALKTYAASIGAGFIDEIGEAWYSGTGFSGTPANNGNRDLFCNTDQIHPTQAGHDNKAARTYTRLVQLGF